MSVWVIVPVKPLENAKSRLAGVLDPGERADLSRELMLRTLRVLAGVSGIEALVTSGDSGALALARGEGASVLREHGSPHLNRALRQAAQSVERRGATAVLVLPSDLPRLESEDVSAMLAMAGEPPVMVIAPDRRSEGTNALLTAPPGSIGYAFGPSSFQRHLELARSAGVRVEVCERPGLRLDLDDPEDLDLLRRGPMAPAGRPA